MVVFLLANLNPDFAIENSIFCSIEDQTNLRFVINLFLRCSFRPARKSNQSGLSKSKKRLAKRNATFIRIRIMSSNYYYFEWGKVIILLIIHAPNNSKLQHPPTPGQTPGIWSCEDWIVQIPAPLSQNGVQIPYPIVGYVCQMPFLKNNRCQLLSSLMQLLYNHAKFPLTVPLLKGKIQSFADYHISSFKFFHLAGVSTHPGKGQTPYPQEGFTSQIPTPWGQNIVKCSRFAKEGCGGCWSFDLIGAWLLHNQRSRSGPSCSNDG